jgi:PAS domain S-box-containing protein
MTQPLRILFVEDVPADQELAERQLSVEGLEFISMRVETKDAFIQALENFKPDLILSDYSMPEFDGMQALKLIQALHLDIPFILLTGSLNEETAVECIKAGASDYVIKEHLHRLPFAMREALKQRQVRKEKEQAEEALRESEAKFKEVFETANVGKSLTLLTGEIDVNQAFCDLLGYTRDELKNKTWQELTPPGDIEVTQKEIALLVNGEKKSTRFNKRYIHKSGSYVWADVSAALLCDPEGKPLHFITTIVDITDRIVTEEALREGENRYRNLIMHSPDAIFVNHNDRVILVNEACVQLFGAKSAEELIGKSVYDLAFPDSHEQIKGRIHRLRNSNEPAPVIETKIIRLDGSIVDVDARAAPFSSGGSNDIHVILRDITERKQAEDLMRLQATALDTAADGILITDRNGIIEWVNTAYTRLTGFSAEEVIGQNPRILKSGVQERAFYKNLWNTILEGKVWHGELVNKRKDGSLYTEEETITPLWSRNGQIEHFIGIKIDISARKQAEEALKREQYLMHTLMDTVPDSIYFKDAQSRFIQINQSQVRKLGVTDPEQVIGKTDFDFFGLDHAQAAFNNEQEIIHTGQPLINIEELETYPDRLSEWVLTTKMPLRDQKGEIIGTFGISRDISKQKQAETQLLRQSEELQRSNIELARLYRTSESLISPKPFDLYGLAQAIVETVALEFDECNCCLHLIKKNTSNLSRLAYAGKFTDKHKDLRLPLDGPGLIPLAIRTRQIVNVADVSSHPDYVIGWEGARSELVIPLLVNDRVVGVIDLESDQLANFTTEDEKLLQTFANHAAVVLENTNLIAETSMQVQRLKSLRKIDETINASLDLGITTGILLEQIMNQLGVDAADILLFSPFTKSLKYINGHGFTTSALIYTDLRLGQGLAGRAAFDRQIVHISDLGSRNEFFNESPLMKEEHFFEYYGVPLISKGSLKGLLEIFNRSPLITDETWLDFMRTMAGQAAIAIDNIQMFENLQRSNNELTMAYDATIEGWSRTLDLRDKDTEGHTKRVTGITVRLAKAIGVQEEELIHIRRGALLHDIGKMGIPDTILLKPGALTDEEWEIMRKHPDYAFILLSTIAFLKPALDIPYCHHEKWDGSGYPRKLKGEQIPLSARLFAVVDVWDALISDRPYRAAWEESKAIEYIREQAGKHFDPYVVEMFINNYLSEQSSMARPTILIVDDEESVTRSLARSLKDRFTVLTATSGEGALKIVERSDPLVVLTDQRMPGMSGVELLEHIRTIKPNTVGILISGYSDVIALTAAINLTTVHGFIPKPWDLDSLRRKLDDAVVQYREMVRGSFNH